MRALEELLCELEANPLVTILAPCKRPCNEGGCIRVNVSQPPRWYRAMCAKFPSSRGVRRGKHDTRIRRANVLQLLNTLITKDRSRSKYAGEVLTIARKRIQP